jgi:hypothetical protein
MKKRALLLGTVPGMGQNMTDPVNGEEVRMQMDPIGIYVEVMS